MEPQIWSDVLVRCQTALATAVAVTAVSNANPAVASAEDHTLQPGDFVLFRAKGVPAFDVAVLRVGAVTADTFVLDGIAGADLAGLTSATAEKITFGASANVITEVTAAGGEASDVLIQTIHPGGAYNRPGKATPLVYTFGALWQPDDPVLVEFARAQRTGGLRAIQYEFADGTLAMFAGYPSASMAPTGSAGAAVTTPAKVSARGHLQPYAGS